MMQPARKKAGGAIVIRYVPAGMYTHDAPPAFRTAFDWATALDKAKETSADPVFPIASLSM
jgi:hypothetical protein